MTSLLSMKQGDLLPSVVAVLHDTDPTTGQPRVMDLTGATVKFHLRLDGAASLVVNRAASIVGAATLGTVQYDWVAGDTDTVGDYLREWEVTYTASGKQVTVPNSKDGLRVKISRQLA